MNQVMMKTSVIPLLGNGVHLPKIDDDLRLYRLNGAAWTVARELILSETDILCRFSVIMMTFFF